MKKNVSLLIVTTLSVLFSVFISILVYAESPAPKAKVTPTESPKKSANSIQVIVSGSGCPQKRSKPSDLTIEADQAQVPLDYEIELTGPALQHKTCQARITIKGEPGLNYEIREVSQNLLFNLQKKSEMHAEISFGIIGLQEFKIDQDVKEAGEYRHILVKKLINYATPCGRDATLRIQTDVKSTGGQKNTFKAEPLSLHIEKRNCKSEY